MAGIFGIAKRGFGKALKAHKQRKMRKGTSTRSERLKYGDRGPTIKSVKPGVGGLKASREAFESVQKSSAEGVRKFGRPHTTKVISEQGVKKGFPGIIKKSGDLERSRKRLGIKKDYSGYEKKK